MDKLADKRVGLIGTGATAVQCVPHLARDALELYVFQRTSPTSTNGAPPAPSTGWSSGPDGALRENLFDWGENSGFEVSGSGQWVMRHRLRTRRAFPDP
jgi:cation diffusion facilitator CzcD-associated flavoprotein CzcO